MPLFTPLQLGKLVDLAKQNRVAPVYIFIGPMEITLEKAKEVYRVLQEKGSVLETYDLRDREQKREFLNSKGYQEGLFGSKKVYLIILGKEDIPQSKVEEILKPFREGLQTFTWFIFPEKMEEDHPLYKFALEKGAIIPYYAKRREDLLETELISILKEYNLLIDKKTAALFLDLVGGDYFHFKRELEKLILYCLGEGTITQEKIWEIVVPLEDSALYLLGDALFNLSPEKVLRTITNLLDLKNKPSDILSYLYKYFKKLQILKEFLRENSELEREESYSHFLRLWEALKENPLQEIPKILRDSHPFSLFSAKKNLQKVSDLAFVFDLLYQAELELKRDYKPPLKVFHNFVFNFWKNLRSASLKQDSKEL